MGIITLVEMLWIKIKETTNEKIWCWSKNANRQINSLDQVCHLWKRKHCRIFESRVVSSNICVGIESLYHRVSCHTSYLQLQIWQLTHAKFISFFPVVVVVVVFVGCLCNISGANTNFTCHYFTFTILL